MSVQFYALWGPEGQESLGEAVYCNSTNGRVLLGLLGYTAGSDVAGDDDPDEFIARVRRAGMRIANTSGADDGAGEYQSGRGARGCHWIDFGGGRHEGYFADRLPELEAVGREAKRHGGRVCWA